MENMGQDTKTDITCSYINLYVQVAKLRNVKMFPSITLG